MGLTWGWWFRDADEEDHNKLTIEFNYSNKISENSTHVWLPVWGEELIKVRTNLGLSEKPMFDYHLTLGMFPCYQEEKQRIYGGKK